MRAVLQRVTRARVTVDGFSVGSIGHGLVVYVGVGDGDGPTEAEWLARRIAELRLFPADERTEESDPARTTERPMDRSLLDVRGAALVISQFTLYADTRKGRRPSFFEAAAPEAAAPLIESVCAHLSAAGVHVESGSFGAHMVVESTNDGPVTILLDSADRGRSNED